MAGRRVEYWGQFWLSDAEVDALEDLVNNDNLQQDVEDERDVEDLHRTGPQRTRAKIRRALPEDAPRAWEEELWDRFERERAVERVYFALTREETHVPIVNPGNNPNHPNPFLPALPQPNIHITAAGHYRHGPLTIPPPPQIHLRETRRRRAHPDDNAEWLQSNLTDRWPHRGYSNNAFDRWTGRQILGEDHWVGQRILGSGSFGGVGLWRNERIDEPPRYSREQIPRPRRIEYVAVKEVFDPNNDLVKESDLMRLMANSEHIVKVARHGSAVPGNRSTRLIMEWLNGGSLSELLERQRYHGEVPGPGPNWAPQAPTYLQEKTLWQIFFCLAQGICQMNTLNDDPNNLPANPPPIIHFDLKPENIFIGQRRFDTTGPRGRRFKRSNAPGGFAAPPPCNHTQNRVFKIGDFGLSQREDRYTNVLRTRFRLIGTHGHYVPEQFTEEWDPGNWTQSNIAGRYSGASNIFQLGMLMWQTVRLSKPPSPIKYRSTRPAFMTPAHPGGLRTYGREIEHHIQGAPAQNPPIPPSAQYSATLIELILECLARRPRHRPSSVDLYNRVLAGLQTFNNANAPVEQFEEWDVGNISGPYYTP